MRKRVDSLLTHICCNLCICALLLDWNIGMNIYVYYRDQIPSQMSFKTSLAIQRLSCSLLFTIQILSVKGQVTKWLNQSQKKNPTHQ